MFRKIAVSVYAIISIIIGLLLVGFSTSINGVNRRIIVAGGLGYIALKRLGGYNGDILGAQQQIPRNRYFISCYNLKIPSSLVWKY